MTWLRVEGTKVILSLSVGCLRRFRFGLVEDERGSYGLHQAEVRRPGLRRRNIRVSANGVSGVGRHAFLGTGVFICLSELDHMLGT